VLLVLLIAYHNWQPCQALSSNECDLLNWDHHRHGLTLKVARLVTVVQSVWKRWVSGLSSFPIDVPTMTGFSPSFCIGCYQIQHSL
jgi:hypothetical protein